jgi:cation:H+ antiporter
MSLDTLPLWANWLLVAIAILFIGKGAQLVVETAARIAKRLRIPDLLVGLTLVAAGTSLPEFGVTLVAAFEEHPDISVGNIVGSNIFNLGFRSPRPECLFGATVQPWSWPLSCCSF